MSAPEESLNDQDPDYISAVSNNQVQQKIYEENARNNTAKKITAIVEKEFSREIDLKEKEVLHIQEKLHTALKTLHFLRYIIITDFYNRKQCQLPQAAETTKQTRIHPAVKSLLGKSPKSTNYVEPAIPSTSTDPRFLFTDESSIFDAKTDNPSKAKEDASERNVEPQTRKRKLSEEESRPRKVPRYVPPKSSAPTSACPSRGERHKIRKRIIVGNISKWIPPDWREDAASHKWTMYVRGDKNDADISTFVSKVRFFLHPSYRPNDVVEVTSSPFHLSRRGWGEFPLRVQLHFKNFLNKPMDIIHYLKLDRTYTGLQTLGSETLVDLWIHTADSRNHNQNISNESVESSANSIFDEEIEQNDRNNSKLTCGQPADTSERLRSQPVANASEQIQVKEEIISSEICASNPSIDLIPMEKSEDVKVKAECTNDETLDSDVVFSIDLHDPTLEKICSYISREHDYSRVQCPNSPRRIVKEGNVTIEHFPENVRSSVTSPSVAGSNEEKSDGAVITSHRCNGDIRSSNDCQPPTVSNIKDASNLSAHRSSLEHPVVQSNDTSKTKDTLMSINGFCKMSDSSLDPLKNLQKATSSSSLGNSHLKPLEISIPPLFASSTGKRVLLMKNKKLISVDVMKSLADGNAKVPITSDGAKLNISRGVSILKKSLMNNVKPSGAQLKSAIDNSKEAVVFTLKGANSLLLNANYNVPALKIADSRDRRYNSNLSDAARDAVSSIDKQESACVRMDDRSERTQRMKITLGKDKHKIQSKKELYEAALQSIEIANITNTEALVRFAVRRLPIVTRDACDPEYRHLHPYACSSEEDFFAHNVGKQRALEWCRAKMIRHFLRKKSIMDDQLWSIREIMMWTKLHGYVPSRGAFGAPKVDATKNTKRLPDSSASATVLSTCTEPVAFQNWLRTCQESSNHRSKNDCLDDEDMEIDVDNVDEILPKSTIDRRANGGSERSDNLPVNSTMTPLELDESLMPLHNFVYDTARNIGTKIKPEEIIPGVMYSAASRMIIRVIECFVEDLTRSSLARAWERNRNECPKIITLDDVRSALASREEFDIFTNEGLGSSQQLNMTN